MNSNTMVIEGCDVGGVVFDKEQGMGIYIS